MTQSTTTNGYTLKTMSSTSVYNYIKRMTRMPYHFANKVNMDCLAEAFICDYGDDCDVEVIDLKRLLIAPGYMTELNFKQMECEVVTSLSFIPKYELAD